MIRRIIDAIERYKFRRRPEDVQKTVRELSSRWIKAIEDFDADAFLEVARDWKPLWSTKLPEASARALIEEYLTLFHLAEASYFQESNTAKNFVANTIGSADVHELLRLPAIVAKLAVFEAQKSPSQLKVQCWLRLLVKMLSHNPITQDFETTARRRHLRDLPWENEYWITTLMRDDRIELQDELLVIFGYAQLKPLLKNRSHNAAIITRAHKVHEVLRAAGAQETKFASLFRKSSLGSLGFNDHDAGRLAFAGVRVTELPENFWFPLGDHPEKLQRRQAILKLAEGLYNCGRSIEDYFQLCQNEIFLRLIQSQPTASVEDLIKNMYTPSVGRRV